MTEAYITENLSMYLALSSKDLASLKSNGEIKTDILKISQHKRNRRFPLSIYLCDEDKLKEDELRTNYNPKKEFEVYISRRKLELLEEDAMRVINTESPRRTLRNISIFLEDTV